MESFRFLARRYWPPVVIAFFVGLYFSNVVRFSSNVPKGDQWVWLREVAIPYQRGDLSLASALTYEYAPLSHSHIPTLAVFLANTEWFGINLAVDYVVGTAALLVLAWSLVRAIQDVTTSVPIQAAAAAVCAAIVFSSAAETFSWSLLQFQWLYISIAVCFACSFERSFKEHPVRHACTAIPIVLLVGDAIGASTVLASLLFVSFQTLRRRCSGRIAFAYWGSASLSLALFAALIQGQRAHSSTSTLQFLQSLVDNPLEAARAGYLAASMLLVRVRFDGTIAGFTEVHLLPLSVGLGITALAFGTWIVIKSETRAIPPSAALLMLSSLIWTAGVIKSRVVDLGAVAVDADRYLSYVSLLGIGIVLVIAHHYEQLSQRFRRITHGLIGTVIVISAITSMGATAVVHPTTQTTDDQAQLTLLAFVDDETSELDVLVPRCAGDYCDDAIDYLKAEGLGIFGE